MNTILAGIVATTAFIAGFGVSMMINSAVHGQQPWSRGDKAAATLIFLVFLALIWIVVAAKLAVTGSPS